MTTAPTARLAAPTARRGATAPSTSASPSSRRLAFHRARRAASRVAASVTDDPHAWERFYLTHSKDGAKGHDVGAFKDRHYLRKVFGELCDADARASPETFRSPLTPETLRNVDEANAVDVLELGCGVGNSVYPLLRANLDMRVVAVDCSPTAVAALRANPEFDSRRVRAHVVDASASGSMRECVEDDSMDAVTAVFFLSALTENGLRHATEEIARVLRPNGVFLFRDYARGDVKSDASSQFVPGERVDGDGKVYRRPDGTLAVFFDADDLNAAFRSVGLEGACEIVTHSVTNRKLGVTIDREFVQGRFVKGRFVKPGEAT